MCLVPPLILGGTKVVSQNLERTKMLTLTVLS